MTIQRIEQIKNQDLQNALEYMGKQTELFTNGIIDEQAHWDAAANYSNTVANIMRVYKTNAEALAGKGGN